MTTFIISAAISYVIVMAALQIYIYKLERKLYGRSRKAREDYSNTGTGSSSRYGAGGLASFSTRERTGESTGVTHSMPLQSIGPLEEVQQIDTIVGYKTVHVTRDDAGVYLISGMRDSYGIEATATCQAFSTMFDKKHKAPKLDCQCGFYAVKEKAGNYQYHVEAEVELYGTVIEHERGYRAEKQRILRLQMPCCFECNKKSTQTVFSRSAYLTDLNLKRTKMVSSVISVCDKHGKKGIEIAQTSLASLGNYDFEIVSNQDIANALGTEVVSEAYKR